MRRLILVISVLALVQRAVLGQQDAIKAFLPQELECDSYVFQPGELPAIRWKNPEAVRKLMGDFDLKTTYYDSAMRQVSRAEKPGRYGAVVEGRLPSGFTIRRFVTLFCSPVEFDDYSENTPIKFNPLESYGISESQWQLYNNRENRFAFGSMKMLPMYDADVAVFLAGLSEMDSASGLAVTPRMSDRQWWVSFKQILHKSQHVSLALTKETKASVALDENPASVLPFTQKQLEHIRAICEEWASTTGVPHVTLVTHKGRIVFRDAFNAANTHVGVDSALWMASITKLLTGVLMMQFVDHRFVEVDSPVARYLPELSSDPRGILTVRHLFTHTTGFEWAGEWASDWNPALENHIAQALPFVEIGKKFSYNRVGYAIVGKVMERLTGVAVPYLFRDHLFTPLGMKSAYADNTYGGLYCSATDLAKFGQMLLNRGRYNGFRFFSENSYRQMLPAKLAGIDRRWGIGTAPLSGHGLSASAFGHLAASGSVLRIDPENDLIIISARNKPSKNQEAFEGKLFEASTAPFTNRHK